MKKRILSVMLAATMTAGMLAGCGGQTDEAGQTSTSTDGISDSSAASTEEDDSKYAIVNKNIKVAQYKGLSIDGMNTEITEDEVNEFIDYILLYTYDPTDGTVTTSTNEDVKTESADKEEEKKDEAEAAKKEGSAIDEDADKEADEKVEDTEEAAPAEEEASSDAKTLTHEDLTDEIVKKISNGDYDNVADYREYVKGVIAEQNEIYYKEDAKNNLFAQVVDNSVLVNYAEEDLQGYIDYANEYYTEYADYLGVTMDVLRTDTLGLETEDDYNNFIREEAMGNLKTEYIIVAIADKESIKITDEEVDAEIQNYIDNNYFSTEEEVLDFVSRDEIITNLKYYKILDIMFDSANVVPYEQVVKTESSSDLIPVEDGTTEQLETTVGEDTVPAAVETVETESTEKVDTDSATE